MDADPKEGESVDVMANIEQRAIADLQANAKLKAKIESDEGAAWGSIKAFFVEQLPPQLDDRDSFAYRLVPKALNFIYGEQNKGWEQYRHPDRKNTSYVRRKK